MNSTIKPKKKTCKCGCGKEGYIFSKGMLKECWSRVYGKPIKRVSYKRMVEDFGDESWSNLRDELDTIFSLYVRIRDCNKDGILECITCDKKVHYKNADAGHWIPRSNMSTRWDEHNVFGQCLNCNRLEYGESEKFSNKIEQRWEGMSDWLTEKARFATKYSISDLRELVVEYREKLKLVKIKLSC